MTPTRTTPQRPLACVRTRHFALGAALLALGVVLEVPAQTTTLTPPPSPFEAPNGPPPVTSTSANGRLGAAPVAPRADELTPPTPIDASAARAAAARDTAPVDSVRDKEQARAAADRASAAR